MISIGGSDWFGIGETGSAAYQGTELCGSRPNCLWTSDCKEKVKAFEDCVKLSNQQMFDLGMAQTQAQRESARLQAENQMNPYLKYALIGTGGLLAVLIIAKALKK
jgi:hypothetical protein